MQTLVVAPGRTVNDGVRTYGPGAAFMAQDTDAPGLIGTGYVLAPGSVVGVGTGVFSGPGWPTAIGANGRPVCPPSDFG